MSSVVKMAFSLYWRNRTFLCKRINGYKSDIKNHNVQKPVGEHVIFIEHPAADLKVTVLLQKSFTDRIKHESAKVEFMKNLRQCTNPRFNRDLGFLTHYIGANMLNIPPLQMLNLLHYLISIRPDVYLSLLF